MHMQINARDFPLTEALVEYLERSIHFELSSRYAQIRSIAVRLSAVKGTHGRLAKCCHIQVGLPRTRDIVIEECDRNVYIAIECALQRAGHVVNRYLKREFFENRKLFISHNTKPLILRSSH